MTIRRAPSVRDRCACWHRSRCGCSPSPACGGDDNNDSSSTLVRGGDHRPAAAQLIRPNAANGSDDAHVGSKNFTEQKVLGEIYAQALAAAGYKVRKRAQPRRREDRAEGAEGRPDRRLPGVHRHGAAVVLRRQGRRRCPRTRTQAYDQVKAGFAKQGIAALPPTPFTSSNEVAVTKATADKSG